MTLLDPVEGHTTKLFDAALARVAPACRFDGRTCDRSGVSTAARALLDGDESLAEVVLAREARLNELERSIDREAFRLIALHQPMASDLRMAKAVLRITVELERVGDESKKIARFAARLASGEDVRHRKQGSELTQ